MARPELLAAVRLQAATHRSCRRTRWPDEAREIVKQGLAYVASDQFDPGTADPSDLATYTRALAALQQWLDPTVADVAMQKLASGINGLDPARGTRPTSSCGRSSKRSGSSARVSTATAIEPARDRLRREIGRAHRRIPPAGGARAIGRAIEIMSPILNHRGAPASGPLPGSPARPGYRFLVGQGDPARTDRASADARSRARRRRPCGRSRRRSRWPPCPSSDQDSAYLLALMQVVETLASMGDQAAVAAFRPGARGAACATQRTAPARRAGARGRAAARAPEW